MPRWRNAALPRTAFNPEALPIPVLSASGAGSVTIVVPQGRSRAPASDSRFMRQGSLVPAAAGCWDVMDAARVWGYTIACTVCRRRRCALPQDATPCPEQRERRSRQRGRPARPAHRAPRCSLPCPPHSGQRPTLPLPRARCQASAGGRQGRRHAHGRPGQRRRNGATAASAAAGGQLTWHDCEADRWSR